MSEDLTFQDLLEEFQEDIFVGRTEQLTFFENALTAPRLPFLILAISGQGGVGKTTLLEQYHRRAAAHEALTAMVNEYQKTVPAVLAGLAEQLEDLGGDFKHFTERYRKYRELQEQVEADPQAPKGMLDFAFRSATRIGLRALRRIPLAGEAADVLLTDEVEDRMVDETSALAAYVARKFTNKDERVLLLETDAELTRHFVTDFNALLKKHRVILCFDTYEETVSVLDTWLRDLLSGKYGKFSGRVLFVIAGRYPLGQAWTGYRRAIRQIELNPFTAEEAREYLQSAGITDEDQIAQLIALSEHLPVLLAFLVSAPGDVPVDVSGTAVERFLQSATSEQREAALVAAVPRYFNLDILAVVLGEQVSPATFDWLSNAHFVRPKSDGWRYHDVVRRLMGDYLYRRSPDHFYGLNISLQIYYQQKAEALNPVNPYNNQQWCSHTLESVYHGLLQETQAQVESAIEIFLLSRLESSSFAQVFLATWQQVARERKKCNLLVEWYESLSLLMLTFADKPSWPIVISSCNMLATLSSLTPLARSRLFFLKGVAYRGQQQLAEAFGAFNSALELNPQSAFALAGRGIVSQQTENYSTALADLTRLLEFDLYNDFALERRGETYLKIKDYPAALADFTHALELDPEDSVTLNQRGQTFHLMGNYSAALADFTRAIKLQPENGSNYCWRGRSHYELAGYPAALADFNRAIELQPEDVYNYAWRGLTYFQQQDYPAALTDFTRAIELQPEDDYNYAWRGSTYFQQQDYPAALPDFSRAIELQPENDDNHYWRGMTYYQQQDYPAALADFTRAIELQPEDSANYYWRGMSYYEQQDYPAALADFTRAIELQPENAFSYARRGIVYLDIDSIEEAEQDFAQAQALLQDDSEPIYIIAAGYARHELPEPACAFLHLAAERNREFLEEAGTDTDFDAIRAAQCFQALVNP